MKVFHAENSSRDYTGHGPMHIFIGREAPAGKSRQEIGWEGRVMGQEMRERGEMRKTEKKSNNMGDL